MKTLRVMLLFFILLYGCSKKYLVSTEEELINREIIASWKSLAGEIRGRSNKKFTLNLKIKDFIKTEDSVKLTEIYKTGENINWAQVLLGGGGVYYGYLYMYSNWPDNEISHGCLGLGLLIPGLVAIADGLTKGYPFTKIIPDRIKIDTVCVDSMLLSKRKIVVSIEKVDLKKNIIPMKMGMLN